MASHNFIRLTRNPDIAFVHRRETPKEIAARIVAGVKATPLVVRQ